MQYDSIMVRYGELTLKGKNKKVFINTLADNIRQSLNDMKELDCIEVIVEKKKYTEDGVHKGMTGWICYDKCVDGYWLVNFPQYGDKPDIATISVHESDMVKIATLNVQINEQIRKQFETKS